MIDVTVDGHGEAAPGADARAARGRATISTSAGTIGAAAAGLRILQSTVAVAVAAQSSRLTATATDDGRLIDGLPAARAARASRRPPRAEPGRVGVHGSQRRARRRPPPDRRGERRRHDDRRRRAADRPGRARVLRGARPGRGRRGADRRRRLRAAVRGPAAHAAAPRRGDAARRRAADAHRPLHRRTRQSRCAVRPERRSTPTPLPAGIQPTSDDSPDARRWSAAGWTRCCTSPTRRSARRRRSRSASSSASRRSSASTRCSAIIFAFLFNLNRVAALLGVYSNLPWIIAPYYAIVTMLGATITGHAPPEGFKAQLAALFELSVFHGEFWHQLITILKPLLWPYTVGSLLGAIVAGRACISARAGIRDKSPPPS